MSRSVRGPSYNRLTTAKEPIMCECPKPAQEYQVGTGSESFWTRPTNRYPGCTCPPWRYNPSQAKPTNPNCQLHGGNHVPDQPATAA